MVQDDLVAVLMGFQDIEYEIAYLFRSFRRLGSLREQPDGEVPNVVLARERSSHRQQSLSEQNEIRDGLLTPIKNQMIPKTVPGTWPREPCGFAPSDASLAS